MDIMKGREVGSTVEQTADKVSRAHEKRLVSRAQSGDRNAIRELIDLHKERLFAFIYRMVRNFHDAEEICQDALLKAFASLDSFSSEFRFSTWLFTIGYRVCLNRLRRKPMVSADFVAASEDLGFRLAGKQKPALQGPFPISAQTHRKTPDKKLVRRHQLHSSHGPHAAARSKKRGGANLHLPFNFARLLGRRLIHSLAGLRLPTRSY